MAYVTLQDPFICHKTHRMYSILALVVYLFLRQNVESLSITMSDIVTVVWLETLDSYENNTVIRYRIVDTHRMS